MPNELRFDGAVVSALSRGWRGGTRSLGSRVPITGGVDAQRLRMQATKSIALIAHDNRKDDLLEWVEYNADVRCSSKNWDREGRLA